jgi:hypothetical protein
MDDLAAAQRARHLAQTEARFGKDSTEAKHERARNAVEAARATVQTDRGLFAAAVRKFGEHSEKAVRAHVKLIEAQTRLREASHALTGALAKNVKACSGQLYPKALDIARPVHAGAPAALSAMSAASGRGILGYGWGGRRPAWEQHFHGDLVMPKTAAPIGDPRYDATKLRRGLGKMGTALTT